MTLSKTRIASTIVLVFFVMLMIYANKIIITQRGHHTVELFVYNSLLVAYNTGGARGMGQELTRILSGDKESSKLETAEKFKEDLPEIKDPGKFLEAIVAEKTTDIKRLKTLRTVAISLIVILLIARTVMYFFLSKKNK